MHTKFANAALGGPVESLRGREVLQSDLDRLKSWAITNYIKFNRSECWILHLGRGNSGYTDKLGNDWLESSPVERDLRVWIDVKLSTS